MRIIIHKPTNNRFLGDQKTSVRIKFLREEISEINRIAAKYKLKPDKAKEIFIKSQLIRAEGIVTENKFTEEVC